MVLARLSRQGGRPQGGRGKNKYMENEYIPNQGNNTANGTGEKKEENEQTVSQNFAWQRKEAVNKNEDKMVQQPLNGIGEEKKEKESGSIGGFVAAIMFIAVIGGIYYYSNRGIINEVKNPVRNLNQDLQKQLLLPPAPGVPPEAKVAPVQGWVTPAGNYNLKIDNQTAGRKIIISKLEFPSAGWVAIYTSEASQPKTILSTYRFSQGSLENFVMPLIVELAPNTIYHAVIHNSNDDKIFNYNVDTPVFDNKANRLITTFKIL